LIFLFAPCKNAINSVAFASSQAREASNQFDIREWIDKKWNVVCRILRVSQATHLSYCSNNIPRELSSTVLTRWRLGTVFPTTPGGLPVPGLHSYRPTKYFYGKSASAWQPRVTTEVHKKTLCNRNISRIDKL
jgi:hypothetical protein